MSGEGIVEVAVFGATGRTGRILLPKLLGAGYSVRAFVRDPSRINSYGPKIQVLQGSLQDLAAIEQAVRGAQAVISVLGPSSNEPRYEISKATASILTAMSRSGARRLIVTAGAGVRDPNDVPGAFDRFMGMLVKRMAANVYEDMRRSVEAVRASDVEWTIVRVPVLTDAARSGRVRVGYVGKGTGPRLSRADLADFLLQQLTDATYVCKAPVISS